MARKKKEKKQVQMLKHENASRKNIPTAEYQGMKPEEDKTPIPVSYERRNSDLDPHLFLGRSEKKGAYEKRNRRTEAKCGTPALQFRHRGSKRS